jgi:hypothetical protein
MCRGKDGLFSIIMLWQWILLNVLFEPIGEVRVVLSLDLLPSPLLMKVSVLFSKCSDVLARKRDNHF